MKKSTIKELMHWHDLNHVKNLENRYFNLRHLEPFLNDLSKFFFVEKIGDSFEGRDINKIVIGAGDVNVLLWTQMHGNESTGTRAFLDLISFFSSPGDSQLLVDHLLSKCTIHCIPMLNPDGAEAYTRINAQGIDLNRDVLDIKAPESRLLQDMLKLIDPKFCFNLHDQRTIFSVAPKNNTATMSFLAPSVDEKRTLTEGRKETMRVIASIDKCLQEVIPGRIGRYTDEFYPTATGDNFQKMGHNTILIESGHSKGDYIRMESRKATFLALVAGLNAISGGLKNVDYKEYFNIPNNEKKYLDVIVKNCSVSGHNKDLGILFVEELKDGQIVFKPSIDQIGDLASYNADEFIEGESLEFTDKNDVEKWVNIRFN